MEEEAAGEAGGLEKAEEGTREQSLPLLKPQGKYWRDGELKALKLLGEYSNRRNNSFRLRAFGIRVSNKTFRHLLARQNAQ